MTARKKYDPVEMFHSTTAKAWFWRVKARNGRIVADSAEGYTSEAKARQGFKAAQKLISKATPVAGKRVTPTSKKATKK